MFNMSYIWITKITCNHCVIHCRAECRLYPPTYQRSAIRLPVNRCHQAPIQQLINPGHHVRGPVVLVDLVANIRESLIKGLVVDIGWNVIFLLAGDLARVLDGTNQLVEGEPPSMSSGCFAKTPQTSVITLGWVLLSFQS